MSATTVAVLSLVLMLLLIWGGLHVAVVLGLVSFVGVWIIRDDIGVAGNWGKWGLFYSSSVTFGQLAYPNPFVRGMLWVGAVPMYAGSIAALAPISRGWATQEGASAFAMDWKAGWPWVSRVRGRSIGTSTTVSMRPEATASRSSSIVMAGKLSGERPLRANRLTRSLARP